MIELLISYNCLKSAVTFLITFNYIIIILKEYLFFSNFIMIL